MTIKMISVMPSPIVTASHLAAPLQLLWSDGGHNVPIAQLADTATTETTPQQPTIIDAALHNNIACMYPDCLKTLFKNKKVTALAAASVKR